MQEPFIREYKEERQITMMLIADLSSSNNFGSSEKSKKELIIEIASVLAFLAIKNNDKVGMMIVTDHVEYLIKPKQGKAHIFKLIKDLITFKPESKKTDIKNVLSEAIKIIPKHSIVFYLSDFIDDNSFSNSPKSLAYEQELKILRKIQDLILISIRDRREYKLPNLGFMEINNPESGIKELLNLNKKSVREKFLEKQKKYQNKIKESYKKIGIDFLEITTNKAYTSR